MSDPKRVAVIGAGMAGLTLAGLLAEHASVRILEKSKGLGGRMATRRIADLSFDHGAQYFTVRDPAFRAMLNAAIADGAAAGWEESIVSLPSSTSDQDRSGDARYVGTPDMTSLPKWMARHCDVAFDIEVASVSGEAGNWFLRTSRGEEGPFDWVVATAPAPQSAALLPPSFAHHERLRATAMNACFTLMIPLRRDRVPPFAAARLDNPVISWISRNDTKPGRADAPCLVVNAAPAWSDRNIEAPLETVRAGMLDALGGFIALTASEAESAVIKRWRYANVANPAGRPFLLDRPQQLACCGDWCIAGRVEAAFQSATLLADALLAAFREPAP